MKWLVGTGWRSRHRGIHLTTSPYQERTHERSAPPVCCNQMSAIDSEGPLNQLLSGASLICDLASQVIPFFLSLFPSPALLGGS